jgi:hypothetical protein
VTCEPLCRVPQDMNPDSSMKSVPMSGESPKVDKPPTPDTKMSVLGSSKPPSPGGARNSPGAGGAHSSFTKVAPSSGPVGASSGSRPDESPETSPSCPSPMDSGPLMGTLLVVTLPCPIRRNNHNSTHGLLSPWPITLCSSKPNSISVDSLP